MRDEDPWWVRARCRKADPDIFTARYAYLYRSSARHGKYDWSNAKRFCDACPVKAACLDAALTYEPTRPGDRIRFTMFQGGRNPDELWELYKLRQQWGR